MAWYEYTHVLVETFFIEYDAIPKMKSSNVTKFRRVVEGVNTAADSFETIGRPVISNEDYFVCSSRHWFVQR